MIYLDNGATSFPKPREVSEAMMEALREYCANPGRSGHFLAARTAQEIFKVRLSLARMFHIENPGQIIFTKNGTEGLNLAFQGILREGDHVITTSMEHNAVLRPLQQLKKKGVEITIVRCDKDGRLDPEKVKKAIRGSTRMIAVTAASNVTGTCMPLDVLGQLALRRGILFLVDGAQGAGHMELDVKKQHIDLLAVPGHKGLLGPQGTGFLYVKEGIFLRPLLQGGTGSRSKDWVQPADFPEGFEAGTLNAPGIIGLGAAVQVLHKIGIAVVEDRERKLIRQLQHELENVPQVQLYGPSDPEEKTAVLALNILNLDCEEVASLLNDRYGIAVRAGFHCSGIAHDTIGTAQSGCVRICPGIYTRDEEIRQTISAIKEIARTAAAGK